ncbi:MAG: HAMP domain-containing sensor histidine kinase [Mucilaginibacter sp.]
MFVQITNEEFSRDISKKAWQQTNNIIWAIVFVYPFISIIDFLRIPNIALPFLIARLATVLFIFGLYTLFHKVKLSYRILLHITFLLLSVTSAFACAIVDVSQLGIYLMVYSAILLLLNLLVFWEPVHSIIQSAIAVLLTVALFALFSKYSLAVFISNGGHFFILIAIASCLIPATRFKVTERDVRSQKLIEKSNEQLKEQNKDITEKNKIIDSQYERLLKVDENKNSFMNIAGHDLKNLIGTIMMSNEMIKEEYNRLSDDQKEYLEYISQSTDKMQYLLDKLTDVKEINTGERIFDMEVFDINTELRQIVKGLTEAAEIKNITLIDSIATEPINVKLDKVFTGQILQNLLSNSIKLSQTNNSITIATAHQNNKVVIEIIDKGMAIGQKALDDMFNKLKQLNDAPEIAESKLGLGLSIAKTVTAEMGGNLYYRSDSNGNYFKVEFDALPG